ncbi:hypothetical protein P4S68_23525 [Pseudoalteromonas sp. Hal099]
MLYIEQHGVAAISHVIGSLNSDDSIVFKRGRANCTQSYSY